MFTGNCHKCGNQKTVKTQRSLAAMCRSCAARLATKKRYENGNADGRAKDPIYYRWKYMLYRTNKDKDYIARNIEVCKEWEDFYVFRDWAINNGFKKELHLDRINPHLDYMPTNCRFISPYENTARTQIITQGDIELILKLATLGHNPKEIHNILNKKKG